MSHLHHRNRNRRPKKEARRRPIPGHFDYGDGKDAGKYYRCWNCGFVCDVERDELGGPADRAKIHTKPYTLTDERGETLTDNAASNNYSIFAGEGHRTVRYEPEVESGCPFCGTLNWRGDHP